MSKIKTFVINVFSLYILVIVRLIFPLLTLPYLTRILSIEAYGLTAYVKSLMAYVQLLIDFGFLLSATKKIVLCRDDKQQIGRIVGDTLVEKMILGAIACAAIFIIMFFHSVLRNNALFCFLYLAATLLNIFYLDFLFRGLEQMHLVALPTIIAKSALTVLTFVIIKNDADLLLIPILEIIGNFICISVNLYCFARLKVNIKFNNLHIWYTDLRESLIYFLSNFATTILGSFTTVIVGFYMAMSSVALWGICLQILAAVKALYTPITNALYPYMLKSIQYDVIKRINRIMVLPISLGSTIIILVPDMLLTVIGGSKYISAVNILRLLLPAFIFSYYSMVYGWPVLGALGKVKETTLSTVLAATIQLLSIAVLILCGAFNLYTLAISCSIAEVTLFGVRFVYFQNLKIR